MEINTMRDIKAYKLFLNRPEKWIYGKLNVDSEGEVDKHDSLKYYEFVVQKNFIIYPRRMDPSELDSQVNETEWQWTIANVPDYALDLNPNEVPKVSNLFNFSRDAATIQFQFKKFQAVDDEEAMNKFMEIYNQLPLSGEYRYIQEFEKLMPKEIADDVQILDMPKVIVVEELPKHIEYYNPERAQKCGYSRIFTRDNLMTTHCFELIMCDHCLRKVELSTFSGLLDISFSSKHFNILSTWQNLWRSQLKANEKLAE